MILGFSYRYLQDSEEGLSASAGTQAEERWRSAGRPSRVVGAG